MATTQASAEAASSSGSSSSSSPSASSNPYREVLEWCSPYKLQYDKCFNKWYSQGFLRGNLNNTCDDLFEDYRACVLEGCAARGLKFAGTAEIPAELQKGVR
eukprot:TRINITY_DN23432_c0_g1_i1.p4 TRINITY_DN23432_c0_g1~~TRINITY_DN23432_c0_g1_i1.p4  ORF type:complete len:102 (+),score=26.82 TRINITY_DN23432_c0_g1_i1:100-405(+)